MFLTFPRHIDGYSSNYSDGTHESSYPSLQAFKVEVLEMPRSSDILLGKGKRQTTGSK